MPAHAAREGIGAEESAVRAIEPVPRRAYRQSDYGNAERLSDACSGLLRFCPGVGWLGWDEGRWRRDTNGAAMRLMKGTIRRIYSEARLIEDPDARKALVGFALRSEAESRLRAALKLAETERKLVVDAEELDADPWLLTVLNGTLDLRTGELRRHAPDDLITKLARVAYDPAARSQLWEEFLVRITGRDEEVAVFLQRAVGYSLTGDTREEKLFFAHGPAASGKSTFLEAIRGVLGDYAATADFDTFLKRQHGGGVRNDIARLAGTRMVVGVEVDQGRELAEGVVKQLTGGDKVTARFLYREAFEFTPRFKLWLAANDRPPVRADDDGMWRRIIQVPFTQAIPEGERDPTMKQRLREDPTAQSAILAWALAGCLSWQRDGLAIPTRVRAYTDEYRSENDPVASFLRDACTIDTAEATPRSAMRSAYQQWAFVNGEPALTPKELVAALRRHGVHERGKVGGERAWQGVALTTPQPLGPNPTDDQPF
jgi:putative DNA primase/helicase